MFDMAAGVSQNYFIRSEDNGLAFNWIYKQGADPAKGSCWRLYSPEDRTFLTSQATLPCPPVPPGYSKSN